MNKKRVFYRIAAIILIVYAVIKYASVLIYDIASRLFSGMNIVKVTSLSVSVISFILIVVLAVLLLKTKDKPSGVLIVILSALTVVLPVVALLYAKAPFPAAYINLLPDKLITFVITLLPGFLLLGVFGGKKIPGFILAGLLAIPCASAVISFIGTAARFDFASLEKGIMNGVGTYMTYATAPLVTVTVKLFGILMYVSLALVCIGYALSCIKKS